MTRPAFRLGRAGFYCIRNYLDAGLAVVVLLNAGGRVTVVVPNSDVCLTCGKPEPLAAPRATALSTSAGDPVPPLTVVLLY